MEPYIFIALFAGLLPALFWLWFWLREDKREPEPARLIALTFLAGIAVVPIALPLQKMVMQHYPDSLLIFSWVVIEETLKYVAALAIILWNKEVDEPVDYIIYMVTLALGFASLENALFIFNPLMHGAIGESIVTGMFRFVGSTLLHVLASGLVGVAMAVTFYRALPIKLLAGILGLTVAILIHTLFNTIITIGGGATIITTFFAVWLGIIILFLLFEYAKKLSKVSPQKTF